MPSHLSRTDLIKVKVFAKRFSRFKPQNNFSHNLPAQCRCAKVSKVFRFPVGWLGSSKRDANSLRIRDCKFPQLIALQMGRVAPKRPKSPSNTLQMGASRVRARSVSHMLEMSAAAAARDALRRETFRRRSFASLFSDAINANCAAESVSAARHDDALSYIRLNESIQRADAETARDELMRCHAPFRHK